MVDTSPSAQKYFGDSVTEVLALSAVGKIHPRGVRFKNFVLTGASASLILPTVEFVPNGTRIIVINDVGSVGNLTVGNGGATIIQQFVVPAGQLAEIWLIASETEIVTSQFGYNGAGFAPAHVITGVWTWDIQTYTAKLALG